METNEEEQEQAVVTSSSSPNSIVDALDSIDWYSIHFFLLIWFIIYLEFNEKPENERVVTPELEQILSHIAKTGYSR